MKEDYFEPGLSVWPGHAAEVAEDPGKEEGWHQRRKAEGKKNHAQNKKHKKQIPSIFFFFTSM